MTRFIGWTLNFRDCVDNQSLLFLPGDSLACSTRELSMLAQPQAQTTENVLTRNQEKFRNFHVPHNWWNPLVFLVCVRIELKKLELGAWLAARACEYRMLAKL